MNLTLNKVAKRNPQDRTSDPKHYAVAMHNGKLELDDLATGIADRCSLRRADVYGVLVALVDLIPDELRSGKIISMGDLGSFYISVKSEGETTADEVSTTSVKGYKLVYRPTKKLKKQLLLVDLSISN